MILSDQIIRKTMATVAVAFTLIVVAHATRLTANRQMVTVKKVKDGFVLSDRSTTAPIIICSDDFKGAIRAAGDLRTDIKKVTGNEPAFHFDNMRGSKSAIIIGTIGRSSIIDRLISEKKIDVSDIADRWESSVTEVIEDPLPGIKKALVIAGSDKRGTIYAIYELSEQIGVSPWYWWADVPPARSERLYVKPGRYILGEPSVKYRGIFLNDEAPALTNWVSWKYGMTPVSENPPVPHGVAAYNSEFYSHIFELILRLKGNYLWPAMWNNAFNEDDTLNPKLADEYGIVMGTSHQEPMLRAQKEWDRRYKNTLGYWNWSLHEDTLVKFWREGIRRNKDFESIITMGLRGADDTEMGPGGAAANMAKLERIVSVQRKILAEEISPDVTTIPQMWCLYKEVQDYYDEGLRVPDDITLLWAEDNWGNIRRVPTAEERQRPGGAGIYYHFDYHGGPRSYQWINTNPIPKIWDQLSLAAQYGADRIWIVNAGHFRGYELPIEFFLDLAWDTERYQSTDMRQYTVDWAERLFGSRYSEEIAEIVSSYTRYNGRRKPELLSPATYSLVSYGEADDVVNSYKSLTVRAEMIHHDLPEEMHDAFYHLVLFPVKASSLVNELYVAAGKNDLYARQGRAVTNEWAMQTQLLFSRDTALMNYYNTTYAGGRWNHFMDQAHLGYTNWADPPFNSLRAIKLQHLEPGDAPSMGIAVEGSEGSWPGSSEKPALSGFDRFNRQSRYIDIFNRGRSPFEYNAVATEPWIMLSKTSGNTWKQEKIMVTIDWDAIPEGVNTGEVIVRGTGSEIAVEVKALNHAGPSEEFEGFIEGDGYVSIEAEHYTRKVDFDNAGWELLDGYGKTLSGMRARTVTDAAPLIPGKNAPVLEYRMYLFTTGEVKSIITVSPSLNFIYGRDINIGVSFDEEKPEIITVVPGDYNAQNGNTDWELSVMNNARYVTSVHNIEKEGVHTLSVWMTDPGLVVEKIIVDTGGLRPSYLGPPESYRFLLR